MNARTERRRTRRTTRSDAGQATTFDFRRPTALSREHVRTMQIVQETFGRGLATTLSSQLGSVVGVAVGRIEQRTYDEYIRGLPNPTLLTLLDLAPLDGAAILHLPLDVAFCAIEMLLGGKGYAEQPVRPFTELELLLFRGVADKVLPELRYALEPVLATEPTIVAQEVNPQFAQVAAPTDMMIVISLQIRIEEVSGQGTVCIPFASMQPHLEALSASTNFAAKGAGNVEQHRRRMEEHLAGAPVELAAEFRPVLMSSGDVVRLAVGDVVPLSHPVDEPLLLTVEGVPTLSVRLGRRNRRAAVQVVGGAEPDDPRRRPARWNPSTPTPEPS